MRDRWSEDDAARALSDWGDWGESLALRTYTARLLGADGALVLHGGGNTSVKVVRTDDTGTERRALCVKGSGWDLGRIEPEGHVAVDLDRLLALRDLESMSDEAMVNAHRTRLFDASAPNPSVETLLHAFLPHRFIDHSHADAVVALSNLADGRQRLERALGGDVAFVPYVMPGFQLAQAAARAFEAHPDCIGLVLEHHGLFTFGDTAEQSYRRHIELVNRAEAALPEAPPCRSFDLEAARARAVSLLPALRGTLDGRWIVVHRSDYELLTALGREDLMHLARSGPLTPDHVIRTKPWPAVVTHDGDVRAAIQAFRDRYQAYVGAHIADQTPLDSEPRVIRAPGVGVFGIGATAKAAHIAADIAEQTLRVKHRTAALGPYVGLPHRDLFDMEYWSLEQAKLGRGTEPALGRQVAWISGGAGAIGVGVARELLGAGAHVVLADRSAAGLQRALEALGDPRAHGVICDVTDEADVKRALDEAVLRFGGIDIVVLGAGIALSASLIETSAEDFDRVVAVNLGGVFRCLKAAARRLIAQGTGGHVILISSKNVLGPGADFGAYSASKAGAHQLCKVAALELAPHGVAVNLVAPDAVFAEGDICSGLWAEVGPDRARAKGLTTEELPEHYRRRNLLGARITGSHVGRAVVFFASGQTPTTGSTLPVDGGIPGAFPR